MNKIKVESSTIEEIEYDVDKQELFVTFKNRKKYKYLDVEATWFRKMVEAESVGKFFSLYIKGCYVTELVN